MDIPHIVLTSSQNICEVEEACKKHAQLLHYCNIGTLQAILSNLSFRFSSLDYIHLNDQSEKERLGVEEYAKDHFIACFSHQSNESDKFWYNYAGSQNDEKLLLIFNNFSSNFQNLIHTDYLQTSESKKMYFNRKDATVSTGQRGNLSIDFGCGVYSFNGLLELPRNDPEYDDRVFLETIKIRDVVYLPNDHPIFKANYRQNGRVFFVEESEHHIDLPVLDISPFALYKKADEWADEEETRIIIQLSSHKTKYFDHIFLRLKDEFFSGLTIVKNPWSDRDFQLKIQNVIDRSPLSPTIKATIRIVESQLRNLPLSK